MTAPAGNNVVELASGLERVLSRIEDPSARKIVIMAKWEKGELSEFEAARLIRKLGLVNA